MMCECCYQSRSPFGGGSYSDEVVRHEREGCECTKMTLAGYRRRAGQFWNDRMGMDKREYQHAMEAIYGDRGYYPPPDFTDTSSPHVAGEGSKAKE